MYKQVSVYSNERTDYFTIFDPQKNIIQFYENDSLSHVIDVRKECDGITSLIFNGGSYIYTESGNRLVVKRLKESIFFTISEYEKILLLKCLSDGKLVLLATSKENIDELLIFDVENSKILYTLPLV